ncbi:protein spaetzle isoform X2 [Monomorium pharaonis]|uniref:protein spaetzle isoform X2 n=1 Tax=Monomorium pharaonis TaxID=307658 RepID=UPI00063F43BC|nr:protein spaetzle isoform X2 [Monomorium pharaonis]
MGAPSARRPRRMIVYLALVLVCQTARPVEGHPRTFSEVPPNAGGSSGRRAPISGLIDVAYENGELLRPQEWSRRADDRGADPGIDRTQWDTLRRQESPSDGTTQYKKRKLLQVSSMDPSMYRSGIMPTHRTTSVSMQRGSDEIVFPDRRVAPSTSSQTTVPASACRRRTYCENVAEYPRQLVNAAIAQNASLRFLESVDPMPDIEQRIDLADELSLCRYQEQVVFPQTAQNKEKQWLFIVNQDGLKQGIRIEVCLNDGQECTLSDNFPEGYKSTCKQKYIYRELAAVGSDGNIFKDQFRFPSSCCCHVKFSGDPNVRFGLGLDLSANRTQYK